MLTRVWTTCGRKCRAVTSALARGPEQHLSSVDDNHLGVSREVAASGVLHFDGLFIALTHSYVHKPRGPEKVRQRVADDTPSAARAGVRVCYCSGVGDDVHRNFDIDLGVQVDRHRVTADRFDVRLGQPNGALVEAGAAGLLDRCHDIAGGHRAEQLA
jgi:hypothetical protein